MDKPTKNILELVENLRLCGYSVTDLPGNRKRVTHPDPDDGRQTVIPNALSDRNVRAQIAVLKFKVGYDPNQVERIKAQNRKERQLQADQNAQAAAAKANNMRKAADAASKAATAAKEESLRIEQRPNRAELVQAVDEMAKTGVYVGKAVDVRFDVMEVDYDLARSILDRHNNAYQAPAVVGLHTKTNRPFHAEYTLLGWAKDMVNGAWVLTPHGIAFDLDGNLLDGQNRMKALMLANERWEELLDSRLPGAEERRKDIQANGVRIPVLVSYDWNPEVFDRIDRGKPRGLSDLLAVTGELDRHYLATTGRMVWTFDENKEASRIPASEHVILQFIKDRQPWMSEAVAESRTVSGESRARLLGSAAAAGIYVIRRAWPQTPQEVVSQTDHVADFLYGLGHGYTLDPEGRRLPLEANDARAALRSYLNSQTGRKDRDRRRHMGLLIKTWNRFVEGRSVELMKLGKNEVFPVPVLRDGARWDERKLRYVFD